MDKKCQFCQFCQFKEARKIYSLSGPVTVLFQKLGLLSHLSGISRFHPVESRSFKKKIYPGGLFISTASLKDFENSVLFYDDAQQSQKIFKNIKNGILEKVSSNGLTPLEFIQKLIHQTKPYLHRSCENQVQLLLEKLKRVKKEMIKKTKPLKNLVFFLGELKKNKFPSMLMIQDGVVKMLLNEKVMKSYPSEAPYVQWSAKILSKMPKDTVYVGLVDTGMDGAKKVEKMRYGKSIWYNVWYPGILVPGVSQLEGFHFWLNQL